MALTKTITSDGKVTWTETDESGEVIGVKEEGQAWEAQGGQWGETAIGTPVFIKDIPGGITQKDITEVALIGPDPEKVKTVEIVPERAGVTRTVTRIPLRADYEFYDEGELMATGVGKGEEVKTVTETSSRKPTPTVESILADARYQSEVGPVIVGRGGRELIGITPREQLLLAERFIYQEKKDITISKPSQILFNFSDVVEKAGLKTRSVLSSSIRPEAGEPGRLFGKFYGGFIQAPFRIVTTALRVPASVEGVVQAPGVVPLALAFTVSTQTRAVKDDPLGYAAEIGGGLLFGKALEKYVTRPLLTKKVTRKIGEERITFEEIIVKDTLAGTEETILKPIRPSFPGEAYIEKSFTDPLSGKTITEMVLTDLPEVGGGIYSLRGMGGTTTVDDASAGGGFSLNSFTKGKGGTKVIIGQQILRYPPRQGVSTLNLGEVTKTFPVSEVVSIKPLAYGQMSSMFSLPSAQVESKDLMIPQIKIKDTTSTSKTLMTLTTPKISFLQKQKSKVSSPTKTKIDLGEVTSIVMSDILQTGLGIQTGVGVKTTQASAVKSIGSLSGFFTTFDDPFESRRKKKSKKIKRKTKRSPFDITVSTKYKPSLIATYFDIKGKRPLKLTGLEIRPRGRKK